MPTLTELGQEIQFLFGDRVAKESLEHGPGWYLRRIDRNEFAKRLRDLQSIARVNDRQRFCRELDSVIAGALTQFLMDPNGWNEASLKQEIRALPTKRDFKPGPIPRDEDPAGEGTPDKPSAVKPVRRRRIQSRLRNRKGRQSDGDE